MAAFHAMLNRQPVLKSTSNRDHAKNASLYTADCAMQPATISKSDSRMHGKVILYAAQRSAKPKAPCQHELQPVVLQPNVLKQIADIGRHIQKSAEGEHVICKDWSQLALRQVPDIEKFAGACLCVARIWLCITLLVLPSVPGCPETSLK
eukprot:6196487-Pleurochrysis_carterae.AAC.1